MPTGIDELLDELAGKLSRNDQEKGFHLFERFLNVKEYYKYRIPFSPLIEEYFYDTLHDLDKTRVIKTVLEYALKNPKTSGLILWNLHTKINQINDAKVLIDFALEDEEKAILVSNLLSADKENFWSIAFKIIEAYFDNQEVLENLISAVSRPDNLTTGETSFERGIQKIDQISQLQDLSPNVQEWLTNAKKTLIKQDLFCKMVGVL